MLFCIYNDGNILTKFFNLKMHAIYQFFIYLFSYMMKAIKFLESDLSLDSTLVLLYYNDTK